MGTPVMARHPQPSLHPYPDTEELARVGRGPAVSPAHATAQFYYSLATLSQFQMSSGQRESFLTNPRRLRSMKMILLRCWKIPSSKSLE